MHKALLFYTIGEYTSVERYCKRKGLKPFKTIMKTLDNQPFPDLMTMDEFIGLNQQATETVCMDITDKPAVRVTDEQAKELIRKISKCENVSDFQHLDTDQRNKYLKKLREKGLSIRQLSRLTGISFSVIRNI